MYFSMILLSWILCLFLSCVQDNKNIPDVVKKSFQKHYSDIADVDWEIEGSEFEAEFDKDGVQMSVSFDKNGKITDIEIEDGEIEKGGNDSTSVEIDDDDNEGEEDDD